jgi:6-phosphogluconolactonase
MSRILALILLIVVALLSPLVHAESTRVYVGTYTGKVSKGIYTLTLDLSTGKLSEPELAAETTSPSFLAVHPSNDFIYAVNEVPTFNKEKTGSVTAFSIDAATGKLTQLNAQPSAGTGPCHISLDKAGRFALVANYGGGSVAVLPIASDGKLDPPCSTVQHTGASVNPQRQKEPHAHSINLDRDNRFAFAADLGLDKILVYRFDGQSGKLTPNDPPHATVAPGSGPRHFAFHPTGKFAFANNEMTSTVTAFAYDAGKGVLTEIHTITTLPQEVKGNSTAETVVHPGGKFLYTSNRGHDSIAIFTIDEKSGRLTAAGHQPTGGKTPRNFNVDPTGRFVLAANQNSDSIVVFRIDAATGALTPTGATATVGSPVCVRFVASR